MLKTYNWDDGQVDGWMDGTCRRSGLISVLSLAFSSLSCTVRCTRPLAPVCLPRLFCRVHSAHIDVPSGQSWGQGHKRRRLEK